MVISAALAQQQLQPGDKIVEIGNMSQYVVSDEQVRPAELCGEFARHARTEEAADGGHSLGNCGGGDIGCGLDPEHRNSLGDEMLQQIAVVARDLHHQAAARDAQMGTGQFAVAPRMLNPAVGEGGEVRVLAEDVLGSNELRELHQQAVLADVGVQRIIRLHLVKLCSGDVRLTQRRHSQIGERMAERLAAEAAVQHMFHRLNSGPRMVLGVHHTDGSLYTASRAGASDRCSPRRGRTVLYVKLPEDASRIS